MMISWPCRMSCLFALLSASMAHCRTPVVPVLSALIQPLIEAHLPAQNAGALKGAALRSGGIVCLDGVQASCSYSGGDTFRDTDGTVYTEDPKQENEGLVENL